MTRRSANSDLFTILFLAALLVLLVLGLYLYFHARHAGGPATQTARTTSTGGAGSHFYAGTPRPTDGAAIKVLPNIGYTVGYSETRKNPVWAAYRLFEVNRPPILPRPQGFRPDPRTEAGVTSADYNNSGYDRGHMAPNHAIATHFGKTAQDETFQMSNVCPQRHVLNAEVWERLEKLESDTYANNFHQTWTLVGPIFAERPAVIAHGIQVPARFFRVIIRETGGRPEALAVIMPQEGLKGTESPAQFLTTISDVEAQSRLNLLPDLPPETAAAVKGGRLKGLW